MNIQVDNPVERGLFGTVALVVVTVDAVELWQSSPPESGVGVLRGSVVHREAFECNGRLGN